MIFENRSGFLSLTLNTFFWMWFRLWFRPGFGNFNIFYNLKVLSICVSNKMNKSGDKYWFPVISTHDNVWLLSKKSWIFFFNHEFCIGQISADMASFPWNIHNNCPKISVNISNLNQLYLSNVLDSKWGRTKIRQLQTFKCREKYAKLIEIR